MPTLQAVLLADHVYREDATGKHVIAGAFTQLRARELPYQCTTPFHAFCVMTNVIAPIRVSLRFVAANDEVIMSSSAVTVTCRDPHRWASRACRSRGCR